MKLLLQSTLMALGGSIFPILFLFFPALFLSQTGRQGIVRVMLIFLSVTCLTGAIFGPINGLIMLSLFGPLILVLDYCIRTQRPVGLTILVATLVFLFSIAFNFYTTGVFEALESGSLFKEAMALQEDIISKAQLTDLEADRFLGQVGEALGLLQTLLPAILLLISLATVYVSYSMTGKARLLRGEKIMAPAPFLFVRLPENLIMTSLVASFVLISLAGLLNIEVRALSYNIAFVVSGLLFFQGLAVLNFYLFRFMPIGILRGILIAFLLVLPFVQISLVALGLLDQWFNFRRIQV